MGFFDVVDSVVDTVTETAGKIKNGAKFVEFIAKKGKLFDVENLAKSVGKWASPLSIAPTPILVYGQKVIRGMHATTGEGDPISGASFITGGGAFARLEPDLRAARPDDTWSGGPAPRAYERRVDQQDRHVAILRDADRQIGAVLSREADELREVRRILDGLHNQLAEFGEYSKWVGIGQISKSIQMGIEAEAVRQAVWEASKKLWEMHDLANNNAAVVREALAEYQKVSAEATPQDSVGGFDPPR